MFCSYCALLIIVWGHCVADGGEKASRKPSAADAGRLKVFISYSRRDSLDFADQLGAALETCGFNTLIDRHNTPGGVAWEEHLRSLIVEADTVVFVLSPESAISEVCEWEVEEANKVSKRILPIIAMPLDGKRPPERLQKLQYMHFYREPSVPGSGFGAGLALLVTALNSDLDWLREHTQLLGLANRWADSLRHETRLLTGSAIADAKAWVARQPTTAPDPTPLQFEFLKASEDAEAVKQDAVRKQIDEREQLLRENEEAQKLQAAALERAEVAAKDTAAALASAAEEQKEKAAALEELASEQREKLRSQRRAAAWTYFAAALTLVLFAGTLWSQRTNSIREARVAEYKAGQALKDGDFGKAYRIALAGLPPPGASPLEHWSPKLENDIRQARYHNPEIAVLDGHTGAVRDIVVSKDQKRFVTVGDSAESAILRDTENGVRIKVLKDETNPAQRTSSAAFLGAGERIVTWSSSDAVPVLWHGQSGDLLARLSGSQKDITRLFTTDDGRFVITVHDEEKFARVWSGETGLPLGLLEGHSGSVDTVEHLGSSNRVVTVADGDAVPRLWDLATLSVKVLPDHGNGVTIWPVGDDGAKFITLAEKSPKAQLWDATSGQRLADYEHSGKTVAFVTLSKDGRWAATRAETDNLVRLWSTASSTNWTLSGHERLIKNASFSSDGKRLITIAEGDPTALLWDTETGREIAKLEGHTSAIDRVFWSPNRAVAMTSAQGDTSAWLWDAESGKPVKALAGHGDTIAGAGFSPDGDTLVTYAVNDTTARLWRASTGDLIQRLEGHEQQVSVAKFTEGGLLHTRSTSGKTVRVWDAKQGHLVAVLSGAGGAVADAVATSQPERLLVRSQNDNSARMWALKNTKLISSKPLGWTVTSTLSLCPVCWLRNVSGLLVGPSSFARMEKKKKGVYWQLSLPGLSLTPVALPYAGLMRGVRSGDGKKILTIPFSTGPVHLTAWLEGGTAKTMALDAPDLATTRGHFSPDGRRVMTQSARAAYLWNADEGTRLAEIKSSTEDDISTGFLANGSHLITWSNGGTVVNLWDTETGQLLAPLAGPFKPIGDVVTDSKLPWAVIVAKDEPVAQLWNVKTGTKLADIRGPDGVEMSVTPTADGHFILALSDDLQSVKVWETATGKLTATLTHPGQAVTAITATSDDERVWTRAGEGKLFLWDVPSATQLTEFGKSDAANVANIRTNGAFRSSGSYFNEADRVSLQVLKNGGTLELIDLKTGKRVTRLDGHTADGRDAEIDNLDFSPDSLRLITRAKGDAIPRLWDTKTGQLVKALEGHTGPVRSVVFSEDGKRILTLAINDSHAWLWDAATGAAIAVFRPMGDISIVRAEFGRNATEVLIQSDRTIQSWSVPDEPVLLGRELWTSVCAKVAASATPNLSDPCLRRGPFSPDYYRQILNGLVGRIGALFARTPAPAGATGPGAG